MKLFSRLYPILRHPQLRTCSKAANCHYKIFRRRWGRSIVAVATSSIHLLLGPTPRVKQMPARSDHRHSNGSTCPCLLVYGNRSHERPRSVRWKRLNQCEFVVRKHNEAACYNIERRSRETESRCDSICSIVYISCDIVS